MTPPSRPFAATGIALAAAVLLSGPAAAQAADVPAWLQDVVSMPSGAIADKQDAVVLLDDIAVSVARDGKVTTRRRYAVRVLTRDGTPAASLREVYLTSSSVRSLRAWTIDGARVTQLGKDETVDLAVADNDVYNEVRVRAISAGKLAGPDTVFGAEIETTDRGIFTQLEWVLQDEEPVRRVRRSLTVPPDWKVSWVTLNGPAMEPQREDGAMIWTASDLVSPTIEASGPPLTGLVPRLAVSYFDPSGRMPSFQDWPAVSRWLSDLQAPQAAQTPAIRTKALELTAGAATPAARIAAIAAHIRRVQYISIQTGLGRGGGYVPHAASDVLQKNYGDCKDKANLMRALLASAGIRSTLVAVYSGDPGYVREAWASPQQFNHVIIAIEVPADYQGSAVREVEGLGRVLFYDPTDEQTPVGTLPLTLQDSLGLPVVAERGRLVRLPAASPESHARTRTIEATLLLDGSLTATFHELLSGDSATTERYWREALPGAEYRRRLERSVGRYFRGATLLTGDSHHDPDSRVRIAASIRAQQGQVLSPQTMLVAPPQGAAVTLPSLPSTARTTPVLLELRREEERYELTLPPGIVVEEMPAARAAEAPFGSYAVRWTLEGGKVVRTLRFDLARTTVESGDYPQLTALLEAFREAESQALVLRAGPTP